MKNREHMIRTALVALTCFALWQFAPEGFGVVPAPDGGYPGFNTAEGQNALKNLTTGVGNSAVGWYSLFSNTDGSYNTAVGAGALVLNLGNQSTAEGIENTATGAGALLSNTTGGANTASGAFALLSNTEGDDNTASGFKALFSNTTGTNNTASGDRALRDNTIGTDNTAIGFQALLSNTGEGGSFYGSFNTAAGSQALSANTTGDANAAIGMRALSSNITGIGNTAVGYSSLSSNTNGSGNIALGYEAGSDVTTANNVICIGAHGNNVDNSCFIGSIFGATSPNGVGVFINQFGRLGTVTSSARFKDDIKLMDNASEALLALKPVTFHYKKSIDPQGIPQFGLVAEDVEKVSPDLIVRDKEGKPYSVRYDQVNAMLLNEFLKEHRKVEKLEATAAEQQNTIKDLTAMLKDHTAQIQRVSAQVEMSWLRRVSQVVVNKP